MGARNEYGWEKLSQMRGMENTTKYWIDGKGKIKVAENRTIVNKAYSVPKQF